MKRNEMKWIGLIEKKWKNPQFNFIKYSKSAWIQFYSIDTYIYKIYVYITDSCWLGCQYNVVDSNVQIAAHLHKCVRYATISSTVRT